VATVYRGGGGELQLSVGEVEGIEAEAAWTEAALVVELRVPLAGRGGYTVGAARGTTVGLGIETVDVPDEALQRVRGRRGGPGGGARPGGRDPGSERAQAPTKTRWFRVQLAD
jgi:hypothetical protein